MERFGIGKQSQEFLKGHVRENYDLTPRGIIEILGLLNADFNQESSYGHFGENGMLRER